MRFQWTKLYGGWAQIATRSISCFMMHAANSNTVYRRADLKSVRCSPCSVCKGKISIGSETNDRGVLMERGRFEKWLRNIYETQDEEISCTECFDLISRFVELETSGRN